MSNVTRLKPNYYPSLEERVENYRILNREMKEMENTLQSLRSDIIKSMGNSSSVFNILGHEIATYESQFRNTFNKEEFEKSYPGVYEKFECKKEIKVFRLK